MNKSISWGIIGCSSIATHKVIPAIIDLANVRIKAIASRNVDTSKKYANLFNINRAYGSYDELLQDKEIDAVYISLPNSLHSLWTRKAAEYGKHVLCEKPAGINPTEVKEMIDACVNNNVLFCEGFMYRLHPQHKKVKEMLHSKELGEIRLIKTSFSYQLEDRHSRIKVTESLGGGCLFDIGCYCVNLARMLMEEEPSSALTSAEMSSQHNIDTSFISILEFNEGRKAIIDCSFDVIRRNCYEVICTQGKIEVPEAFIPQNDTIIFITDKNGNRNKISFPFVNQYALEFQYFSDCILNNIPIDMNDSLKNVEALYLIKNSIKNINN